jgi:hypothetical protein
MPGVPIVSPSETTGVPCSNGLPPRLSIRSAMMRANSIMWSLHGVALVYVHDTVISGLKKSSSLKRTARNIALAAVRLIQSGAPG